MDREPLLALYNDSLLVNDHPNAFFTPTEQLFQPTLNEVNKQDIVSIVLNDRHCEAKQTLSPFGWIISAVSSD